MLVNIILEITILYINNLSVKGPRTHYNYIEVALGI
jgi:hypothetical protein